MKCVGNTLLLIIVLCATAAAQPKPQIRYVGITREAALRCLRWFCMGTAVTASPGDQVEFWVAGTNLAGVTGIQFQPPDGIEVSKIQTTQDTVYAVLTVSKDAALGKRAFIVTSPAGDSNLSSRVGILNISTFRISNLKIDNVANTNGALTFRVTFNYTDPSGAVSSEGLEYISDLSFAGHFSRYMSVKKFNPDGRTPGAKAGVMSYVMSYADSYTNSYTNMQRTTLAEFKIRLGAKDGRESDTLQAVF